MIRSLDTTALNRAFQTAEPFPWVCIDDFLEPELARELARSYPAYEVAARQGKTFDAVNEKRKVQITDPAQFSEPVRRLADYCATPEFRSVLSEITGIPNLLWDTGFAGGGMHQTAAHGTLDVHIDFNRLESGLYRRVNLLLYLNEEWNPSWGGRLELWDSNVRRRHHAFVPTLNRCVIFETSERSFHGVEALTCPPSIVRRSFALYYYTREAPSDADGQLHSTVFRARPDEHLKRYVLMPSERLRRAVRRTKDKLRDEARGIAARVRSLSAR